MKTFYLFAAVLLFMATAQRAQAQCTISAMIQDSSWRCDSSASLMAIAQTGTAPFSFVWNTGQTTANIWNMPNFATYSVTITDAQGCTGTSTFVSAPNAGAPTVTGVVTRQGCSGNGLGAAVDVTVSGGVPPYTYGWSNGETTEDAQNLPGSGYLSVYDAVGCYAYYTPNVTGIQLYQPYTRAASCSQNNGSAGVYTQGNNFSYLWTSGQTTNQVSGLAAGWYALTVTNTNTNCTLIQDFNVGYDPNCETTITGTIYNATSTGTCVSGLPLMYSGWVSLRDANGSTVGYGYVYNGVYTITTRVPATYTLAYHNNYGNTNLATLCPNAGSHTVATLATGGTISGNDFYVTYPYQVDVSADVYMGGAAPGFSHNQYGRICNNGGTAATGVGSYTYDAVLGSPNSTYFYSNFYSNNSQNNNCTVSNQTVGNINFTYTIQPGECVAFYLYFTLPTNVALGTILTSTLSTNQPNDGNTANNIDTARTTVVGSYDPNDKRMMNHRSGDDYEGGIYAQDTKLEYVVRFQNTGTAPARRVVIRDVLEANLRPETVSAMAMSHNGVARIENGNELVVEFNNIYLPDSATDLEGSQGYIKFEIERNANLAIGTSIENSVGIYFDFNAPIITNTAISTLEAVIVSVENLANAMEVRVMPNPFVSQIAVQYELKASSKVNVRLYNALGQVAVEMNPANQTAGQQTIMLSTDQLSSGIYYLEVQTNEGKFVQKVVKQ